MSLQGEGLGPGLSLPAHADHHQLTHLPKQCSRKEALWGKEGPFQLPKMPTLGGTTLARHSCAAQPSLAAGQRGGCYTAFQMERAEHELQHVLLTPKPPLQDLPGPQLLRGSPLSPGVWLLR